MWAAMLTCDVNIAVFAAFRMCFDLRSVSNAEFKPVWTMRQLDVSRYGWQKRQETATKWQGELATFEECGKGVTSLGDDSSSVVGSQHTCQG